MSEKVNTADLSFMAVTQPMSMRVKMQSSIYYIKNIRKSNSSDTYSVAILSTELRVYMHAWTVVCNKTECGVQFAAAALMRLIVCDRTKSKTKPNKTKQNKTKQNKTKQNKTKQNKTKQNKTKQSKAKQSKAKQSKAKQNKTKQNKTKQNKTKQNHEYILLSHASYINYIIL